ncbi:MAG: TonB-dependent receptor [Pseudobdellovibrionaceae bacterium]
MRIILFLTICLFSFYPDSSKAQEESVSINTSSISGQLLERGTQIPLKGINIFILPHKIKATTDKDGRFDFSNIPAGSFQWVVNASGYQRLEKNDSTVGGIDEQNLKRTLYLQKENYLGFQTTVVGQKNRRDLSKKSLQTAEFLNLPGAGGDPVKAVQNLPGVNRVAGFSSNVIIQGSAPKDTKYNIDGHEIPLVFHFGGLTSVITPEAVSEVEYLSAGYGPENSRALGGVINLKTRTAEVTERDQKGFFFIDNLKSGGLYEKKLSDTSDILISGRYSYIGLFLKQVLKNRDDFNLTVAPEFADFSMVYNKKINSTDDVKTLFIASRDTLGFVFTEPLRDDPGVRGNFKNQTTFYRLIPQWTRRLDQDRTVKFSVGIGQDALTVDVGDNFFNLKSNVLTTRGEMEKIWNEKLKSQFGFDNTYSRAHVDLKLPLFYDGGGVNNPVAASTTKELSADAKISNLGLFLRNEWQAEKDLSLIPSLRLDRFSQTKQILVSPRLVAKKEINPYFTLKAASGLYYQPPEPAETAQDFGNPDLQAPQAIHTMLGFEKDFREGRSDGWQWSASFFRRDFDHLVVSSTDLVQRNGSTVTEAYNNKGTGFAYGIENQIKFDLAPWTGWVSYTLSESRRNDPNHANYLYQYDQTHNINVVGSYDWGNNWKFSGRYRYVTGNPFTPVIGSRFDGDNDVYVPLRGPFYSSRQNPFQQLDLRFDKKWIYDQQIWSFYLDIQNVLNAKNTEDVRYSYNYEAREDVTGLPFLPALGVKGEF